MQLPPEHGGLGGSAVYVFTEGDPAVSRLQELESLLKYRWETRQSLPCAPLAGAGPAR